MNHRKVLALAAATVAAALAPSAAALAAGAPKVTVRIEGKTRTLLGTKLVQTHTGSITKGGAPKGACPATSAAGALDVATHHSWGAKFDTSFNDYELTSVLGETWSFTSPNFWSEWINNRFASTGICGSKLHAGDRVLFAAIPSKGAPEEPLGLSGPAKPKFGHQFELKVVAFTANGVAKPLAGAHVHGSGVDATSNSSGIVRITPNGTGRLTFRADKPGFIRAPALRVKVS
jgi:hypothetical protein